MLKALAAATAKPPRIPFAVTDGPFLKFYREYLVNHYFTGIEEEYRKSEAFTNDIAEHTHLRTVRFHDALVPWTQKVFDLTGSTVCEIGSGTGSSTIAFAPYVDRIHCFELDKKSTHAAQARLNFFNVQNVSFEDELFGPQSSFVTAGRLADIVLFVAVLEHMTFNELDAALKAAFTALRPGGIIIVAETPNRLSVFDYHSSWLPFYQWLPLDVRRRYHNRSPRQHFAYDIGNVSKASPKEVEERLTRWGRGISYHDFELALGEGVHDMIVADGWEPEVRALAPVFKDDEILLDIFKKFEISANKAFARSWLYLILRKPID